MEFAAYQPSFPPALYKLSPQSTARPQSKAAHIARVKAALLRGAHSTLEGEGFTQVIAPTLTSLVGACGDPGTLIPVNFNGEESYLSQTSQLHLEPYMRELGRVYSIGRSFRAERRHDDRHLTEFTLVEGEALDLTLEDSMTLVERMVVNMVDQAIASAGQHLESLDVDLDDLTDVRAPFTRMTYDNAVVALQQMGYFIEWGEDFSNSHELALTMMTGGPLFVTHYPLELRFFTMKVCRDDPRVVECCDLLMPGVGEIMGASETESDADLLERRLHSSRGVKQVLHLGGSASDYSWYIDMHRQSSARHSGFGMGFERLVRYACGLRSVHEC